MICFYYKCCHLIAGSKEKSILKPDIFACNNTWIRRVLKTLLDPDLLVGYSMPQFLPQLRLLRDT